MGKKRVGERSAYALTTYWNIVDYMGRVGAYAKLQKYFRLVQIENILGSIYGCIFVVSKERSDASS